MHGTVIDCLASEQEICMLGWINPVRNSVFGIESIDIHQIRQVGGTPLLTMRIGTLKPGVDPQSVWLRSIEMLLDALDSEIDKMRVEILKMEGLAYQGRCDLENGNLAGLQRLLDNMDNILRSFGV